ncbi:hypothetical protein BDY17DRAFT_306911 [Neohortaea acidophila]|uniref:Stress response protein ish1 n=1 Tax=Neohortaea acidophila TaxID=245834 RepID=A0A6A6Q832_9PEZI|nr:uncharacterized protein BDY17DRAFT_306911 [Neohortaea acidophila]KAF2487537.1 hypothetical protein BDY17DRAFT_306911 [Neohortaea acidophila]
MKLSVLLLVSGSAIALGDWFGNAAYNKWHETELERWLSDNNIPYPTPADRKDLENLVKTNWEDYVAKPYSKWDAPQLSSYLTSQGKEIKKGTEKDVKSLAGQVQSAWYETADQANDAYNSVQDWFFDTWTESQLKSFLDHHGIPNPSPRTRDSLLSTARSNYQSIANKAGETFNYPGDWLFSSWSESDLKAWLDERGIPAPQPTSRDKLIASLRRNSRVAANEASKYAASASQSASSAQQYLSDQLLDTWSESQVKEWLDKQGVKVPQGSKMNELRALARKHSAQLTASGASAYGAATSSAGNFVAQATNDVWAQGRYYYDYLLNQFGLASEEAKSSISSAASVASVSASNSLSSLGSQAAKSAPSAASEASRSLSSLSSSLSSLASKSGPSVASEASSSLSSLSSSLSSLASKSGPSAASEASKSLSSVYSSLSSLASKSGPSVASEASKSLSSLSSGLSSLASKSGPAVASEASKSLSSLSSSLSSLASKSGPSAASEASKSLSSVYSTLSSLASKSGPSAASEASKSASSLSSSLSSLASKSGPSAASVASKSAASAASIASKSAASAASVASKSAASVRNEL